MTDIPAWAEIAKKHQIPLIIDNTVATAFLVQPLTLGADVVINSTSKYINGNSSAISGVITDGGSFKWDVSRYPGMKDYVKFGRFAFTAKLRNGLFRNMGACMAPQTAYYNLLGMETLGLRMERACDNAAQLAACLEEIPGIEPMACGSGPVVRWQIRSDINDPGRKQGQGFFHYEYSKDSTDCFQYWRYEDIDRTSGIDTGGTQYRTGKSGCSGL